jgi:DNA-binding NtrC family response regulator
VHFYLTTTLKDIFRWFSLRVELKLLPQEILGEFVTKLIAVVDDEVEMEQIYSLLLENQIKRGILKIKFFSDSRTFVDWMSHNEPDMILSDINMPHLDGPEIMKLVKKAGRSIPTYFVSGHDESDFKKMMKELGVFRFLSKPLNFNNVLGLIELDLGILSANL